MAFRHPEILGRQFMSWVSAFRLNLAARHLRRGGILAYPTEAVYGLGCDPQNGEAVKRLLRLKKRPQDKGLIVLAASFDQVEPFLRMEAVALRKPMLAGWPGPTTWVVPARSWVPSWLCRHNRTLAVRVTSHTPAAALCRAFRGPVVSTSANPGRARPARTPLKVRRYFRGTELMVLPGRLGGQDKPTAIYDGQTGERLR